MYVETVIYNEQNKILLLKEKRDDDKIRWDLPGATFTEEQSFDETVITNVPKEIGYYVYPGKIIGIGDYTNKTNKEVHVIMEGSILNGELLLSKNYDTYNWVDLERIRDYPLVPWLHSYIHNNKNPFQDVEAEIEELTNQRQRRREIIQEDLMSSINSKNKSEKINRGVTSSFGLLKETIKKTFHPREAKVSQTTPKSNEIYKEPEVKKEDKRIADKLNVRFRHKPEEETVDKSVLESENDIIIEHDNVENIRPKEPEIKIIRKDEKTPHIRTEKESKDRFSFNSENIIRSGWKEKLNQLNRTEANDEKKNIPRPRGKRK